MDGGGGNGLKRPLETDGETTRASGGGTAKTGAASTTSTGGAPKGLLSGNVKPKDNGSAKLFLEDTVRMKEAPHTICMVTRTWHDVEDPIEPEDMIFLQRGRNVPPQVLTEVLTTGQCPKSYAIVTPATLAAGPLIVRETDMEVIDRTFMFGDLVKRSHTDSTSGVVIGVSSTLNIRHCFIDEIEEELGDTTPGTAPPAQSTTQIPKRRRKRSSSTADSANTAPIVKGVQEEELELTVDWEEGTYIVYKNSWLGVVERVEKEITVRLDNDTVVVPEDPKLCYLPYGDGKKGSKSTAQAGDGPAASRERGQRPSLPPFLPGGGGGGAYDYTPNSQTGLPSPSMGHCVGQRIQTDRANIRRGRWIYGAYNPNVEPEGVIVRTRTVALGFNWITQNVFSSVNVNEQPPAWIEEDELRSIKRFVKSFDGLKGNGTGGGQLQVGDRVQFRDLPEAVKKYDGRSPGQEGNGAVKKYPRELSMGFNLDTFYVEATETWAEIQWQDQSVTKEKAMDLVPYWNVDEHDAYPGEIVFAKEQMEQIDGSSEHTGDVLKPKRVGVVQTLNAKERVAKVRWFEGTTLEVLDNAILPGTTTGTITSTVEDMSVYELVQHPAVNFRRGDLVLIAPYVPIPISRSPSEQQISSAPFPLRLDDNPEINNIMQLVRGLRAMGGLAPDALAQFAQSDIPQMQVIHRLLQLIPQGSDVDPTPEDIYRAVTESRNLMSGSTREDWLGEIVDLNLDGLITVRLGALETPRDIKVPIEFLTIIPTEDEDFVGGPDGGDDYDSMEESDEEAIEEVVYEGGMRVEDDGGEDAWATESEEGDDDSSDDSDEEMEDAVEDQEDVSEEAKTHSQPSESTAPAPPTAPPSTGPAPEAITLSNRAISPFLIIGTAPPADHAYINEPPVSLDNAFLRRVMKEHRILMESLPEGIIVRTWDARLDLLRVLIVGPMNTPYELAPFVIDLRLGRRFPYEPPSAYFHSWTGGVGRINPNLYEDGKICLSLLGTWHSEQDNETWSPKSTLLQLFVSIMGLVLVKDPYYNEAGFTIYVGTTESELNSSLYSEKAYILARGFVKHALTHPVSGFENEIRQIYFERNGGMGLLKKVVENVESVIARSEKKEENTEQEGRTVSLGAVVMLKRVLGGLKGILEKEES